MLKPTGTHITIRDVAAAAGCSHATVSRVLRGEPRVSKELREKVKATASKLGYRINPLVASLMAVHNTRKARQTVTANIAWLNTHPDKSYWHAHPTTRSYFHAARERTLELGFGFDEIWTKEAKLTSERLTSLLHARGVYGLLVSQSCKGFLEIGFDAAEFTVAAIGPPMIGQLAWNRATVSNRQKLETAYERLRERGYQIIGFAIPVRAFSKEQINGFNRQKFEPTRHKLLSSDQAALAGFYYQQSFQPEAERLNPFLYDRDDEAHFIQDLGRWIKQVKPDAVICSDRAVLEAIEQVGLQVPRDIGIAHLNIADDVSDWSGMNHHPEEQAYAAVDLLCTSLQFGHPGLPEVPRCIYIPGEWQDGWTAPQR